MPSVSFSSSCVLLTLLLASTTLATTNQYTYETHHITQFVDHYSLTTNRTFEQKYLVHKDYWCGNECPILFYCGSEGRDGHIEMFANENSGWMWDYGKQLRAMIVFAEHRYYGDSKPFPDIDETKPPREQMDKLGYLTTHQILADFAKLIHLLKHDKYSAPDSPVIAVGGGYGGMLAAWLRMKYPNAVIGAWASSAPIFLRKELVDCRLMSELATREYAKVSMNCMNTIKRSWQAMRNIINEPEHGPVLFSALMNLCKPLEDSSEPWRINYWLIEYWYVLLMTDYQSSADFYAKLPARPLVEVCHILDSLPSYPAPLNSDYHVVRKISEAVQFFLLHQNNFTSTCFEPTKPLYPKYLFEVQAGLELIFGHCAGGEEDMFRRFEFDLEKWEKYYSTLTGMRPRFDGLRTLYHTDDLRPYSNIIFTLPSRDPYSVASPRRSLLERSIYSMPVEEAAYMEDLRARSVGDLDSIIKVRQLVASVMKHWIADYTGSKSEANDNSSRSEL